MSEDEDDERAPLFNSCKQGPRRLYQRVILASLSIDRSTVLADAITNVDSTGIVRTTRPRARWVARELEQDIPPLCTIAQAAVDSVMTDFHQPENNSHLPARLRESIFGSVESHLASIGYTKPNETGTSFHRLMIPWDDIQEIRRTLCLPLYDAAEPEPEDPDLGMSSVGLQLSTLRVPEGVSFDSPSSGPTDSAIARLATAYHDALELTTKVNPSVTDDDLGSEDEDGATQVDSDPEIPEPWEPSFSCQELEAALQESYGPEYQLPRRRPASRRIIHIE